MTPINFRPLRQFQPRLFDRGGGVQRVGMTQLRKGTVLNVLGEAYNSWVILKTNIQGTLLPEEGALRALAQGTQNVEDFRFITEPIFTSDHEPAIRAGDRLVDGSVTINPDGTYTTSTNGVVYRVQYVQRYTGQELWQIRLKVGQDER
jgi:hypothetical protein